MLLSGSDAHDTRQGDKSKFESTSGMDLACVVLMIEMIGWMPRSPSGTPTWCGSSDILSRNCTRPQTRQACSVKDRGEVSTLHLWRHAR